MNQTKRTQIIARLADSIPEPTTELEYKSNFELLVAVILSAQATDISVNKATEVLYKVANTPQAIIELGEEKLKSYIKTIGLFNAKAKNIMATCKLLLTEHKGIVPDTMQELIKLPGVGRKTANVVLNVAFDKPTIAVDTHIFRVSNRTKLAPGKTPLAVELKLNKATPAEYKKNIHHWLIIHGRYVCQARKPHCDKCCIAELCEFKNKCVKDT